MARLQPFFPRTHGQPLVDDHRVLSGIIFINRNGLRWQDPPREYGPAKTLYNRWKRWSDKGVFVAILDGLLKADWLLVDRGCDADWFRDALEEKGITPCIPGRKYRTKPLKYDKRRYKSRNRIEIMFGRLKDWRRAAARYDRCPTVFLSAVALAATVLFWP
jgi:transposase